MKLSIQGLQILPSKLGRNGKPRGLRFFHDGIAYCAVQLLGENDDGVILPGDDRLPVPGIEFLIMGFRNQLNLVDEEYTHFCRSDSGKKPSLKVLPEFAYDADTDSGIYCKGKCGKQIKKPKARKEKRAKARAEGRCEFKLGLQGVPEVD